MGGSLGVESSLGEGSTFAFTLPFSRSEQSEHDDIVTSATAAVRTLANVSVLVVEDNAVNQLVIRRMLDHLECQYELIDRGEKVLETLQHNRPDVVLMDIEMPGIDGYEATRRVREHEQDGNQPRLPIIALTAHAMAEHRRKAEACGMDDHLAKPVTIDRLRKALTLHALG